MAQRTFIINAVRAPLPLNTDSERPHRAERKANQSRVSLPLRVRVGAGKTTIRGMWLRCLTVTKITAQTMVAICNLALGANASAQPFIVIAGSCVLAPKAYHELQCSNAGLE
jgi:hypothetical protein